MNPLTKQILVTAAGAAVAATVTALVTHWLVKDATIASVASGATPLPPGSTPSTLKSAPGPGTTTPGGTSPAPNLPTGGGGSSQINGGGGGSNTAPVNQTTQAAISLSQLLAPNQGEWNLKTATQFSS
jgi:hypothetical protein